MFVYLTYKTNLSSGEVLIGYSVKAYLHLAHQGMVGTMDELATLGVCALVYILNLEAALLEIPPLEAEDSLVLVHTESSIEVEEVIRAYEIELLRNDSDTASDVSTAADSLVILTFKVLSVDIERT